MSEGKRRSRSARVMESRRIAQRERSAVAANFREQLTRELTIDGSFSQARLIDIAISCSVEISTISARFVRCIATSDEMTRLQAARLQLVRTLRALGLAKGSAEAPEEPPGAALRQWAEERRAREEAAARAKDGPSEAQSDASEVES